jgi:hypothetical protein
MSTLAALASSRSTSLAGYPAVVTRFVLLLACDSPLRAMAGRARRGVVERAHSDWLERRASGSPERQNDLIHPTERSAAHSSEAHSTIVIHLCAHRRLDPDGSIHNR